jgi:hypothetical protein
MSISNGMTLIFGIDRLCPKCISRNRKGLRYSRGYLIKSDKQVTSSMVVIEYMARGMVRIECPRCKGKGIIHGNARLQTG